MNFTLVLNFEHITKIINAHNAIKEVSFINEDIARIAPIIIKFRFVFWYKKIKNDNVINEEIMGSSITALLFLKKSSFIENKKRDAVGTTLLCDKSLAM